MKDILIRNFIPIASLAALSALLFTNRTLNYKTIHIFKMGCLSLLTDIEKYGSFVLSGVTGDYGKK